MSESKSQTKEPLFLEREPVDGTCPRCGRSDLRKYPVHSEGGWFLVVKCQDCLLSVERERWALLGPVKLLSDTL